ncbi:recombinase family protein [Jannaschia sp. LMIT008]|uniref:recombinase family protein n=1 Tax=Jannaschia maritima TaxID=3032585 RepID=UPI0028111069|nr:recombinase family protein [Jannaschia sp. LMIT008]
MTDFVLYRRVSTAQQGRSGLGLEAQARDLDLYLSGRAGPDANVIGTYTDIQSGARADRPELAKAVQAAKDAGAVLLVAKLDRLSRNVAFIANLLEDADLQLRVAAMPDADRFALHVYAALAEQERTFISERTKAALAMAKARGVRLGGLRPNTVRRNEHVSAKADADAKRIAPIVRPLRNAGASLRTIAKALTDEGIETPRGGAWTATAVRRALSRIEAKTSTSIA